MTSYRLWPATNGPSTGISYSGNFIAGTVFAVQGGGKWLEGYWWWVAGSTQDTTPVKCALWSATTGTGVSFVVPGSVVTSGTLTAGQWNWIPLPTPIQLAASWDTNASFNGSVYIAAIGWVASIGFPDTVGYWSASITNGPLHAYAGSGVSGSQAPNSYPQGIFTVAGSDPSTTMPQSASGTDNFWVDPQITDTAPVGYNGTYRIWPNKCDANSNTVGDLNVNYTVATEIHLTQSCTLNNIWYFSLGSATTLATRCDVWDINTGLSVASITSPAWKDRNGSSYTAGSVGAGAWIKAAFAGGTTLPAGSYRVSVFNSNGTSDTNWSPKDAVTDYWGQTFTGAGSGGITNGPLSAPDDPHASSGYVYGGSSSDTPPFSSGGTTVAHAQPPFGQNGGGTVQYPQLYAVVGVGSNQSQNYWVDLEATLNAQTLVLPVAQESIAAPVPTIGVSPALARAQESINALAPSVSIPAQVSLSVAHITITARALDIAGIGPPTPGEPGGGVSSRSYGGTVS